jgi:hypothetical protein
MGKERFELIEQVFLHSKEIAFLIQKFRLSTQCFRIGPISNAVYVEDIVDVRLN